MGPRPRRDPRCQLHLRVEVVDQEEVHVGIVSRTYELERYRIVSRFTVRAVTPGGLHPGRGPVVPTRSQDRLLGKETGGRAGVTRSGQPGVRRRYRRWPAREPPQSCSGSKFSTRNRSVNDSSTAQTNSRSSTPRRGSQFETACAPAPPIHFVPGGSVTSRSFSSPSRGQRWISLRPLCQNRELPSAVQPRGCSPPPEATAVSVTVSPRDQAPVGASVLREARSHDPAVVWRPDRRSDNSRRTDCRPAVHAAPLPRTSWTRAPPRRRAPLLPCQRPYSISRPRSTSTPR